MKEDNPLVEGDEDSDDDSGDDPFASPTFKYQHTPSLRNISSPQGERSLASPGKSMMSPGSIRSFQSFREPPPTLTGRKSILIGKTTQTTSTELKRRQSDVYKAFDFASGKAGQNFSSIEDSDELTKRQRRGSMLNNKKHEMYQKKLKTTKEMSFANFKSDFIKQRSLLLPQDIASFDREWRWNNETQSFMGDAEPSLIPGIFPTLEDKIRKEILKAEKNAEKHLEVLQKHDSEKIGLDILHLFVIDMLGRDTVGAKTFRIKSRDE